MANYFNIGKLSAVYGTEGEFILKHSLGKRTALKDITAVFIEDRKNSFFPYFVQHARAKDTEHVYIKLEGIDTRESARNLLQKGIYLEEKDFKGLASSSAPLSLLGFQVTDKVHGPLGAIEEIIEMPLQVLARVMYREKEMLLPINEQTLVKIDQKQQTVQLDLPEGLLDIYLG